MNEVMTLAEIKERFNSEWVLIADPEVDEHFQIIRGKIVWHSKNRDEVYRKAAEMQLKHTAFLYTGTIPENTAVVL